MNFDIEEFIVFVVAAFLALTILMLLLAIEKVEIAKSCPCMAECMAEEVEK